jgi:hypothetical protein
MAQLLRNGAGKPVRNNPSPLAPYPSRSTQTVYPNQDFGYVVVPGSKVAVFGRMKADGGRVNFLILHPSSVILNFKEADLGS